MHLILDLDGTLVSEGEKNCIARPFLKFFFDIVFILFETVSIWTAASQDWYDECYKNILSPLMGDKKFYFVYTSINCSNKTNKKAILEGDYYALPIILKPLKKIWKKYKNQSISFNKKNTLIIDNTYETFSENYGNALLIRTFTGSQQDKDFLEIVKWMFKNIPDCEDITKIKKLI